MVLSLKVHLPHPQEQEWLFVVAVVVPRTLVMGVTVSVHCSPPAIPEESAPADAG